MTDLPLLLLIVEMGTLLNGKGIGLEHLLSLVVYGMPLEECKAIAASLTYELPSEIVEGMGKLTGQVMSTCVVYK